MVLWVFLFIPLFAYTNDAPDSFTYLYAGRTRTVKIGEALGARVNEKCLQNRKECRALKVWNAPSAIDQIRKVQDANYSGAYCELLKGTQLFLLQNKIPQQFCVFSDQTMIDAKALYLRHSVPFGGAKP